MSTRFTIICDTCGVTGPYIRRRHSRAILEQRSAAAFFPEVRRDEAVAEWGEFLSDHEYHELRLATEYRSPKPPKPPREPTHRLGYDGTLEEF